MTFLGILGILMAFFGGQMIVTTTPAILGVLVFGFGLVIAAICGGVRQIIRAIEDNTKAVQEAEGAVRGTPPKTPGNPGGAARGEPEWRSRPPVDR